MIKHLKVLSEQHWHQLRAENVGASEVAALFGLSPYISRFTLWHQKAGRIATPDFDSERIKWGTRLETAIAHGIAEDQLWKIRKVKRYLINPSVKGMGASLDFEIVGHRDGVGAFEIKNVDGSRWRADWLIAGDDSTIEAPFHIELQLQHQMAVTGYQWGAIGLLIGGNEGHVLIRKRHEPTIKKLQRAVAEFWSSIEAGDAPPFSEASDLSIISDLFQGSRSIDLSHSLEFEGLCKDLCHLNSVKKQTESAIQKTKVQIAAILADQEAEVALSEKFKATFKETSTEGYTVAPKTYRTLRVSERRTPNVPTAND